MVEVVKTPEEADAILKVRVKTANPSVLATTSAKFLFPSGAGVGVDGPTNRVVASVYNASLGAEFTLERTHPESKKDLVVWTGMFSRSKAFPATNLLGALGSTSALINDSEFDRALQDLARSLVEEAHNNMLLRF